MERGTDPSAAWCSTMDTPLHACAAGRNVGDVAFEEAVPLPCLFADRGANFVEVAAISGRKVVEADHVLPEAQQRFDQMGADEPGAAGDEPAQGLFPQFPVQCFMRGHQSLHT